MKTTTRLRQIYSKGLLVAPGAFDGLSAKLIEQAGFAAVYSSGGAIARSAGVPDLGLMDLSENIARIAQITEAVTVPVIADADTGYGNALNAHRTARMLERAGVAGFHMEDQALPKKCGHFEGKKLVSTREFVGKIKAVRDALHDDDFVVVARTDAIGVEGFDAALERAHAYAEAGADVLFVEAPESEEQIERIARELPLPKLINMFYGGKTPLVPLKRLEELGYAICIIPSDLQRTVIRAMQDTLEVLKRDGNAGAIQDRMAGFTERDDVVDMADYSELDRKYGG